MGTWIILTNVVTVTIVIALVYMSKKKRDLTIRHSAFTVSAMPLTVNDNSYYPGNVSTTKRPAS